MSEWLKNNAWAIVLVAAGIVFNYATMQSDLLNGGMRFQKIETRLSSLESKTAQMDIILYRVEKMEDSVKEINKEMKDLKATFVNASSAMSVRFSRIEVLLEKVLEGTHTPKK